MRIRLRHIVLTIIILSILLLCMYPLLGHPRVFSVHRDIDINSGDVRVEIYACFFRIKNEIQVTPFSQEIRRLGIRVPEKRLWKRAQTKLLTWKYIGYQYGGTIVKCNFLIKVLDATNVPDQDRLVILKRVLMSLQKGKGMIAKAEINDQLQALSKKLGK